MKEKKRLISMMWVIAMLIVVLSVPAYADSRDINTGDDVESSEIALKADVSGTCGYSGDNMTWTLSGDTLTISGSGKMANYGYGSEECWFNYRENIKKVVIKNGVEHIGFCAFYNCTSLTSIELPDSLKSIDYDAFRSCTSLTSIELPDSLKSIGSDVFCSCTSLTSIELPDGLRKLGRGAFRSCTSLTSIELPDGLYDLDDDTFYGCTSLLSIKLPNGLKSIGETTFQSCASLRNIELPDGLKSIGEAAFDNCASLRSIELPDSLISIGASAFRRCNSLTSIELPDSVTSIDDYTFFDCSSLTNIELPDRLINIGGNAFNSCSSLKSIELPDGLTNIGFAAFYYCTSLISIDLPDSLANIGASAFGSCNSLTSIELPDSLKSIGQTAFENCASLISIDMPDSITSIDFGTFDSCTSLKSIELPDNLMSIGEYAFRGCSSLMSINLPDNLTSIGDRAFSGCSSLNSITLPDSLMNIGDSVFDGCRILKNIYYSGSEEDWKKIEGSANLYINGATIHYNYIGATPVVEPTTSSLRISAVTGQEKIFTSFYTAQDKSRIDEEISNLKFSYDQSKLELDKDGAFSTVIKSSDNSWASVSIGVIPKKTGIHEIKVSSQISNHRPGASISIMDEELIETDTISVVAEPKLTIPGEHDPDSANNGACYTVNCSGVEERVTREVTFNIILDEPNKEFLESFLQGIKIYALEIADRHAASWEKSYQIDDEGKTAKLTLNITCPKDLSDTTTYLVVETDAQKKIVEIHRNMGYYSDTFYNGFLIGRDNNSYPHHNNAPNGGFVGRNNHLFTDNRFYDVLTDGLSSSKKNYIKARMIDPWEGSCYGVALSIALVYQRYVSIHDISNSNATNYFGLIPRLDKDRKFSNMIEYYYLSQWINKGGKTAIDSQTYSDSFGLKDLVNNYSSLDYTLSRIVTKALNCNRNGGCFVLAYEYIGDDDQPKGHVVVVLGCQLTNNGYNIIVYDENEQEGIIYDYLTIYENNNKYTKFRFNHENVNSDNYRSIKVFDLEAMKDTPVLSQKIRDIHVEGDESENNAFSVANDATARILASNDVSRDSDTEEIEISFYGDSSFRLTTSRGETLEYRGGEFSGDIELLSFDTYIANEKPLYSISIRSDAEYVIENIDSNLDIEILDDNNYYAVESDDIDKFSLDFENGLVLYGEDYNFAVKIGIDSDDSTALLSVSGDSDKNLAVDISDGNLELKPNGSLNDIVVSVYDGTDKHESEYERINSDIAVNIDDISERVPTQTSVEAFVARLYRNLLGREYESDGLEAWTDALVNNKTTGAKVIYKFVYSDEFQTNPLNNTAFVTAMYETILGREPDDDGFNAWVKVLENGCTRKKVLAGFLNSEEMRELCSSIGIEAGSYYSDEIVDKNTKVTYFVSRMYRCCLGREADYDGLTSWVSALLDGHATGTKIANGFFYSDEMKNMGLSNRDYVTNAYVALLDRQPDANGMNAWIDALDKGADRMKIVKGFVGSQEFKNLCAEYGIAR